MHRESGDDARGAAQQCRFPQYFRVSWPGTRDLRNDCIAKAVTTPAGRRNSAGFLNISECHGLARVICATTASRKR